MTDFEREVSTSLGELKSGVNEIKAALERDYKHLHGNGAPGLIERVTKLEERVEAASGHRGAIVGTAAFIVNAAIAIYAALKK